MNNTHLFHELMGEKICFAELSLNDALDIHSYASDKDVKRFIGWKLMKTIDETRSHIETMLKREEAGTHYYASIVLKSTRKVVGTVMIFDFDKEANQAEIGYVFHKDHWGKGYGTEALSLLSDFAFETLKLHRLNANVVDVNIGSARILEKNSFMLEGRLKDYYFIDDKYYDKLIYGRTQPE